MNCVISKMFLCLVVFSWASDSRAEILRFFQVSPTVYRGSQPVADADFEMLRSHGVTTLISMNDSKKWRDYEKAKAEEFGMQYLWFPISSFWTPSKAKVKPALQAMIEPKNGTVFVHCQQGKDRTGMMVGFYRVYVEGWTPKDAREEMAKFNFSPWALGPLRFFWAWVKGGLLD